MKNIKVFFLILTITVAGVVLSLRFLGRSPLAVFVLRGVDNNIEAFKIELFLDHRDAMTRSLALDRDQEKLAVGVLKTKDVKGLEALSKDFGKYPIVIGLPTLDEGWPGYLGGGYKGFLQNDPLGGFDNLQAADRLYLAVNTQVPPAPPVADTEVTAPVTAKLSPGSVPVTPVAASSPVVTPVPGVVRVEILNGCGITNAAEWVARRLKGPGIVISNTDNADNFHYPKTLVRSAAGLPVALEEALERLGVPKESVEEIANPPGGIDVVIIIGKDFRKLKGKARERSHH